MSAEHTYELSMRWTGNRGEGTSHYKAYGRDHEVSAPGKPTIQGSSDSAFRGDPTCWNPEELLVAALSQCHMLAYLHQAAINGIVVVDYRDEPLGVMVETPGGGGRFRQVTLRPVVTVADSDMQNVALKLHDAAQDTCFIAASVNFPVLHRPTVTTGSSRPGD